MSVASAWIGLSPILGECKQLPELDLRSDLVLARLPEPDLASGEWILPGVHLDTKGSTRQLLYVTGCRDPHGGTYIALRTSTHEAVHGIR